MEHLKNIANSTAAFVGETATAAYQTGASAASTAYEAVSAAAGTAYEYGAAAACAAAGTVGREYAEYCNAEPTILDYVGFGLIGAQLKAYLDKKIG